VPNITQACPLNFIWMQARLLEQVLRLGGLTALADGALAAGTAL
jgi:hypothetical protein